MEEKIRQSITAFTEEANGEEALKMLYMSAYFVPAKNMHLDMFLGLFDDNEKDLDAAIQLLQKKSLIESHKKQAFLVKKNVQNETRTFLKQNGKEVSVLTEAIYLLTFHLLKDEIHPNYVDHALSLLTYVREFDELTEISVNLPSLIVTALRRQNKLGEAYTFGKIALEFLEKTVGESHAAILSLQHNLATVLEARGEYAKAIKSLQELIKKDLKYSTSGEITQSLILHARALCELSKYEDALPLYQMILGERTLDSKIALDSEIATAWHDYALLLSDMGRHSEAMDILQDVLSQRKKVLSPDDQYGLSTKRSMATVLQAQGKYIPAMKQLQEVFHESTKIYGEYDSRTLQAERDSGTLLLHKGDHKKALKKLEKVEKKFQKIFAESHPDTLCTRANIVGTLIHLKEYDRALQIAEDIYEAYKKIFGEKQRETLQAKFNIGKIFLKQGKLEEAEHMLQDVYRGYHDIFGPEHHKTVEMKVILDMLAAGRKKYFPDRRILHAAAQEGDLNKIVSLIQNGENVNEADSEGRRPLHYAASNGHLKVAKYLLMMGAMYNAKDFRKATPYQLASDEHMKDLLILIHELFKGVKCGILINIAGHTELINTRDKNGYSLLHWAVYHSHKSVVQQLLDAGADPKCISLKGNTPLHVASSKGNKEIAEVLLQSVTGNELSDLVNFKTTGGGNTALHVAAKNNDRDMLKCLLMYGAIYDIQNKDGRTPVQLSTDLSIGDLLLVIHKMFKNVREGNSAAITQLKLIINDDLSIVTKARNSHGHTLLQIAIKNQHRDITHGLLEILKDINHVT